MLCPSLILFFVTDCHFIAIRCTDPLTKRCCSPDRRPQSSPEGSHPQCPRQGHARVPGVGESRMRTPPAGQLRKILDSWSEGQCHSTASLECSVSCARTFAGGAIWGSMSQLQIAWTPALDLHRVLLAPSSIGCQKYSQLRPCIG